jgi:TRAP-type C4-dicarboxylate transport system permease small subunit
MFVLSFLLEKNPENLEEAIASVASMVVTVLPFVLIYFCRMIFNDNFAKKIKF